MTDNTSDERQEGGELRVQTDDVIRFPQRELLVVEGRERNTVIRNITILEDRFFDVDYVPELIDVLERMYITSTIENFDDSLEADIVEFRSIFRNLLEPLPPEIGIQILTILGALFIAAIGSVRSSISVEDDPEIFEMMTNAINHIQLSARVNLISTISLDAYGGEGYADQIGEAFFFELDRFYDVLMTSEPPKPLLYYKTYTRLRILSETLRWYLFN